MWINLVFAKSPIDMENVTKSLAQDPYAWRLSAIGLKKSADIIWQQLFKIFQRL
jgi:hypothetical protein